MSIRRVSVRIGTTQWHNGPPRAGEVSYAGPVYPDVDGVPGMVWDAAINNIRPRTDAERTAADVAAVVASIKIEARRRISSRFPEWKQANMTARAVELVGAGAASGPEWEALQAAWTWVKSVRSHSDSLEVLAAQGKPVDLVNGWPR